MRKDILRAAVLLLALSALLVALPAFASNSSASSKTRSQAGSEVHTLMLVDAKTGEIDSYLPDPDSQGPASVVSDRRGGWYVSGRFAHIGDIPRRGLAHLRSDGSVDPTFVPRLPKEAVSLGWILLHGSVLYVTDYDQGVFALDAQSGKRLWHTSAGAGRANISAQVFSLAFGNGVLYACGDYVRIGGVARDGIAALDATTGKPTPWQVRLSGSSAAWPAVFSVAVGYGAVYLGGDFSRVNGAKRELGLVAVSPRTGRPTGWSPRRVGVAKRLVKANSLLVTHGQVLAGSLDGGFAAFDARSGGVPSWPKRLEGTVWALASSGDTAYLGAAPNRSISRVGGEPVNNLASVVLPQGKFTSWRPNLDGCTNVQAIAAFKARVLVAGSLSTTPCS